MPVEAEGGARRSRDGRGALALMDADMRFLMATGALARAVGLPRESLLGQSAGELLGDVPRPAGPPGVATVLQHFLAADGSAVWEELRLTPLLGSDPPRAVFELRDVTADYGRSAAGTVPVPRLVVGSHELLLERIERALAARRLAGLPCLLLFVDIDRFGRLNESMGHLVGDVVLTEVGTRLRHCIRSSDSVVRWGGDEFVVLVESLVDAGEALVLASRIAEVLQQPVEHGGRDFALSASVGLAVALADEQVSAVELLGRADAAMYRAKTAGGGHWSLYDDELRRRGARREHLETLLDRAVPERRVELHYQPIVEVATSRTVGAEALLRLRDEDLSLVGPLEFLSFAEETGAIVPVDREVLRQACAACTRWRALGHDLSISVNLSARQLTQVEDLEGLLEEVLEDTGLPHDRLTCELTEHGLTDTGPGTRAGIARMVRSGLHFSVDDFGTGYNSLTYLRVLPVQEIKVDQSFLADAAVEPLSRAIVSALAAMARDAGIRCVAEGVEDPQQHELLLELGVPYAQGWLYGRPAPYDAFTAQLSR